MTHLVPIRGGELPQRLVLVREGVNTLTDAALEQACQRPHELMGIRGFSALEPPRGGFEARAPPSPAASSAERADGRRPFRRGCRLRAPAHVGLSALVGDRSRARTKTVRTDPRSVFDADPEPDVPTTTELAWTS